MSLVTSHRLATIRSANRTIVVHDGRVIETGPHGEFMRQRGLYARLYRLNYASVDDVSEELLLSPTGRSKQLAAHPKRAARRPASRRA